MIAVRPDLVEAHRLAWDHVTSPGSWWTGAQRRALAETVILAIRDDDPLPPWVAMSTTDRRPDEAQAPGAAHDIAYRIARHAGTITRDVAESAMARLGALPFVELCGIVSSVAAVVHFHRNVGRPLPELPEPTDGDPTGAQPDEIVEATLNWVPVAAPADQTAAVVQAYSAVPGTFDNTWRLASAQYIPSEEMVHPDWMRRPDGLTRPQAELVAARVAQLRECFY